MPSPSILRKTLDAMPPISKRARKNAAKQAPCVTEGTQNSKNGLECSKGLSTGYGKIREERIRNVCADAES